MQQSCFDIKIKYQPTNSHELNVLDLGLFRTIQSLKDNEAPRTIDGLVAKVKKVFETFSSLMYNHIFLFYNHACSA